MVHECAIKNTHRQNKPKKMMNLIKFGKNRRIPPGDEQNDPVRKVKEPKKSKNVRTLLSKQSLSPSQTQDRGMQWPVPGQVNWK